MSVQMHRFPNRWWNKGIGKQWIVAQAERSEWFSRLKNIRFCTIFWFVDWFRCKLSSMLNIPILKCHDLLAQIFKHVHRLTKFYAYICDWVLYVFHFIMKNWRNTSTYFLQWFSQQNPSVRKYLIFRKSIKWTRMQYQLLTLLYKMSCSNPKICGLRERYTWLLTYRLTKRWKGTAIFVYLSFADWNRSPRMPGKRERIQRIGFFLLLK